MLLLNGQVSSVSQCIPKGYQALETARAERYSLHIDVLPDTLSIGTKEICCPKCHFSSIQNHNFVHNFVQISNFHPSVVELLKGI